MHLSLIVIDDFLNDPWAFRKQAMALDYVPSQKGAYYPGRNSRQRLTIPNIDQLVSTLVHQPVRSRPLDGPNSHAKCRLTLAGEEGEGDIHIDDTIWSGILYLNPPEQCEGGTDFFRHKATGTDRAPLTLQEMQDLGFKDAEDVWTNLIRKDSRNRDAWEPIHRVPMKFNRLILLHPQLWHAPAPGFGTGIEDGRLVYLLFFDPA